MLVAISFVYLNFTADLPFAVILFKSKFAVINTVVPSINVPGSYSVCVPVKATCISFNP